MADIFTQPGRPADQTAVLEIDPQVKGFICYCADRCGRKWPALYDEMCWQASRRGYQGLGYNELKQKGLSLALANLDRTYGLVASVCEMGQ